MAGKRKQVVAPKEPDRGAYVVTPEIKQQFLERYESPFAAFFPTAREVGVSGQAVEDAMVRDPEFAAAVYEANRRRVELLETEAFIRAVVGWEEPIFYNGVMIGTMRRKSDRLLELLLRAHAPEKYRDNVSVKNNGGGGGVLLLDQPMTEAMWEAAADLMRKQQLAIDNG